MGRGNLAKMAQQMQAGMARVDAELQELRVEGSAGGGAVKAVATGKLDNFLAQELARHGFDLEAYKAESQANPGVAIS